jgi:hypothetical protein
MARALAVEESIERVSVDERFGTRPVQVSPFPGSPTPMSDSRQRRVATPRRLEA